jgi:hypothetical protein
VTAQTRRARLQLAIFTTHALAQQFSARSCTAPKSSSPQRGGKRSTSRSSFATLSSKPLSRASRRRATGQASRRYGTERLGLRRTWPHSRRTSRRRRARNSTVATFARNSCTCRRRLAGFKRRRFLDKRARGLSSFWGASRGRSLPIEETSRNSDVRIHPPTREHALR